MSQLVRTLSSKLLNGVPAVVKSALERAPFNQEVYRPSIRKEIKMELYVD
jgi:hypothetical protein